MIVDYWSADLLVKNSFTDLFLESREKKLESKYAIQPYKAGITQRLFLKWHFYCTRTYD